MIHYKYNLGNLLVAAVSGWLDVTRQVEANNPPFTLARTDGVGVLQFSVASYRSGGVPSITVDSLKHLLTDFSHSRELGVGFDPLIHEDKMLICAKSYRSGTQFIRVWYWSNRRDIVLITYVCETGGEQAELADCEEMVLALDSAT